MVHALTCALWEVTYVDDGHCRGNRQHCCDCKRVIPVIGGCVMVYTHHPTNSTSTARTTYHNALHSSCDSFHRSHSSCAAYVCVYRVCRLPQSMCQHPSCAQTQMSGLHTDVSALLMMNGTVNPSTNGHAMQNHLGGDATPCATVEDAYIRPFSAKTCSTVAS